MFEIHHYNRSIAIELKSPDKAFMVEFIKWSIEYKKDQEDQKPQADGRYYTWDTYQTWQNRMPWLSLRSIASYLKDIRDSGLVKAAHLSQNQFDRTLFYTINYESYRKMCEMHLADFASSDNAEFAQSNVQDLPVLLTKTLTNTLTKTHTRRVIELHKNCIPFDEEIAAQWLDHAKSITPNGRYNKIGFANAIMKIRTKQSMSEDQIRYLLNFIKADDFWKTRATSPEALFKKSKADSALTKLDQVVKAIMGRKKTKSERVMESILRTEASVMADDYDPLRLT